MLHRDHSFLHQSNKMLLLLFFFFFFASIAKFRLICCQFHMDVCSLTDWRDGPSDRATERTSDRRPQRPRNVVLWKKAGEARRWTSIRFLDVRDWRESSWEILGFKGFFFSAATRQLLRDAHGDNEFSTKFHFLVSFSSTVWTRLRISCGPMLLLLSPPPLCNWILFSFLFFCGCGEEGEERDFRAYVPACIQQVFCLFVCSGVQFRESVSSNSWKEDLCNNQTKSIFFFFFFFFLLFLLHTLPLFVLQLLFLLAAIQGGTASSWSMHTMHSRHESWKATCRFLCNFVGDMWWKFWQCSWLLNPDLLPPDSHCALNLFLLSIRSWERCPIQQRSHALLGCEAHNCQGGPVERSHALLCVKLIIAKKQSQKKEGEGVGICL